MNRRPSTELPRRPPRQDPAAGMFAVFAARQLGAEQAQKGVRDHG
jgi:hypothetical protein